MIIYFTLQELLLALIFVALVLIWARLRVISYDMKGGLSSKENDEVPSTKSIGFLTTVNDEKKAP